MEWLMAVESYRHSTAPIQWCLNLHFLYIGIFTSIFYIFVPADFYPTLSSGTG
jgi:hypothetical protein